jgi:hypothetical protein
MEAEEQGRKRGRHKLIRSWAEKKNIMGLRRKAKGRNIRLAANETQHQRVTHRSRSTCIFVHNLAAINNL